MLQLVFQQHPASAIPIPYPDRDVAITSMSSSHISPALYLCPISSSYRRTCKTFSRSRAVRGHSHATIVGTILSAISYLSPTDVSLTLIPIFSSYSDPASVRTNGLQEGRNGKMADLIGEYSHLRLSCRSQLTYVLACKRP